MKQKGISQIIFTAIIFISVIGCEKEARLTGNSTPVSEMALKSAPVSGGTVFTTIDRTIVAVAVPESSPLMKPWEVASFTKYGYGKWSFGPGIPCEKRFDLMAAGYCGTSTKKRGDLLRFFTISDIHITDKEAPSQTIYYSFIPWIFQSALSCYSPSMIYSTHVLNAAINTVNVLDHQDPFDFGISLGDMANTSIYKEIRWFIDVIDGKEINPDSGKKDDPIKGPDNDYQDKYRAVGLNKSIPWYATIGNHDHFFIGAERFNERIKKSFTGNKILQLGNLFADEDPLNLTTFSMGTLDGSSLNGDVIGAGRVAEMTTFPTIPPDPDRRVITKEEMMKEFSRTSSVPKGHGFNSPNLFDGCYSFKPKSGLPLKVIVLDDTMDESDPSRPKKGYGGGSLGNGRFEWLIKQLQGGQKEGELMIIAAHVPIGVEPEGSVTGWYPDKITENEIITKCQEYPNLILWLAGHRHRNTVTPFPSSDPIHPEYGFWEVETKSLREFPQQFRTFDIRLNNDNTISIFTINIDPEVKDYPFAANSRFLAIAAYQAYGLDKLITTEGPSSYNAELLKPLTPEMQLTLKKFASKSTK